METKLTLLDLHLTFYQGRMPYKVPYREYHDCGEEYNVERREKGSNFIFSIILRLPGRISSGEGNDNFWEENQV